MSQNEQDESRRQFEQEGEALLIKGRVTKLESEQEQARKRDEEYKGLQIRYNKRVAWFTLGLVCTSLVTNIIYLDMSCTARKNAENARIAAVVSTKASCTAAKALKDSETSFAQTLSQMKAQTAAQQDAANAAKSAAKTADQTLKNSIYALRVGERPYITVENIRLDPALEQIHNPLTVKLDFHNAGRTPALKATFTADTFINGEKTLEMPRRFPSEWLIPSDRNVSTSMTTQIGAPGDLEGIITGTRGLSIKGKIIYTDIFKEWHSTTFCVVYDPKRKEWVYCPGSNIE